MTEVAEGIYIVTTKTAGRRRRQTSHCSDGHLDIKFSTSGSNGFGTSGEQCFTDDLRACFEDAVGIAVFRLKAVRADAIDAEYDFCIVDGQHSLQVHLDVRVPCLPPDLARRLADAAGQTCPHANFTDAELDLVFDEV